MNSIIVLVPSLRVGGQERIAVLTAEILSKVYNTEIVVFDGSVIDFETNVKIVDFSLSSKGPLFRVCNSILRAIKLSIEIHRLQPIAVYSFGPTANLVNIISKKKGKTLIGVRSLEKNSIINRYIYKKADLIICNSQQMVDIISKMNLTLGEKCISINNPIDIDSYIDDSKTDITDYDFCKTTIVSHGRLDPIKNYPRLIKAIYILIKKGYDLQLLIIGAGEEKIRLQHLIETYNLSSHVTLLGYKKNPFPYLSEADIYVLSSFSEGFPNSLLEGMVFLPVVSSDCDTGPREILSEGDYHNKTDGTEKADYGILVNNDHSFDNYDDINDYDYTLASGIEVFLKDENYRNIMQKKAQQRVRKYSKEEYIGRINKVFKYTESKSRLENDKK